jgi:hypothetical protein
VANALAIPAVSAALQNLVTQAVHADSELSGAEITVAPINKAPKNDNTNQVNLFLYQTTPNAAWRNADPPVAHPGDTAQPPLALDLHYLLTVYGAGSDEIMAHRMLGRAMRVLHDHSVLNRQEVAAALAGNDLADQVERIRISLEPLTLDEMSKLWSSFQKEYRTSTAYTVSVVLIDSDRASRTPLPVLTRGDGDVGAILLPEPTPPFPALERAEPPERRHAAILDDVVVLQGHHLDGVQWVQLETNRLAAPLELAPLAGGTDRMVRVRLPNDPVALPAGLYRVWVTILEPDGDVSATNEIALAVAPEIVSFAPNPAPRDGTGAVTLTATVRPSVLPTQPASLLLGAREVRSQAHPAPTTTLTFVVRPAAPGRHWLRMRVDGVDSPLVDRAVDPPVFDPSQRITIT